MWIDESNAQAFERGMDLLDRTLQHLDGGEVGRGMQGLFDGLRELQPWFAEDEWERFVRERIPAHGVMQRVHEAPVSRHSFERPRGYPGDADLIDYLYGLREPEGASDLGHEIHTWLVSRRASRGVRHRREWLADVLDETATRTSGRGRVLSVACGHLREGVLSGAFRTGWFDEVLALDADAESLEVAAASNPKVVRPVQLSVARLPRRAKNLGTFDLIYSAGLFDYLDTELASSLVTSLFDVLRPGGRLVIGNVLPAVNDMPFMEAFMDWRLRERSAKDLEGLFADVPAGARSPLYHHRDPYGVFGYVECWKRSEGAREADA